jgi:spore coat polysaccharide biosynthesis protein SpsF
LSVARERVVGVIQARMTSTRLPGKVLVKLGEDSALEMIIRRLQRARELDDLVVATSDDASDDPIVLECRRLGVTTVRGSRVRIAGCRRSCSYHRGLSVHRSGGG